jgi:hypothetical protein
MAAGVFIRVFLCGCGRMGQFAPSNRENELRVEKLYLLAGLAEKLDSGKVGLEDYIGLFWQFSPERAKHTQIFLEALIQARREGRRYTQEDFASFKKVCTSGNNREIILKKLLHMGVIEKKNKTIHEYEITLSDKWINRLELLLQNWVMLTR